MGKGIACVRPFDSTLPLWPIEVKLENNKCCLEIHDSSDSTVESTFSKDIGYCDVWSKGLVQANNSKHFPIDQYLHDRVTPSTLSPKPIAYDKPIDPSEMPRISTCTDTMTDDTNVLTKDDKYPWLDQDDKWRHMTDAEILRQKLNLEDSLLDEKRKRGVFDKDWWLSWCIQSQIWNRYLPIHRSSPQVKKMKCHFLYDHILCGKNRKKLFRMKWTG